MVWWNAEQSGGQWRKGKLLHVYSLDYQGEDVTEGIEKFSFNVCIAKLYELTNAISRLNVNDTIKEELRAISPYNYTGIDLF